jgi:hypothetical protein
MRTQGFVLMLALTLVACTKRVPAHVEGNDEEQSETFHAQLEELKSRPQPESCRDRCGQARDVCTLSGQICALSARHADRADLQQRCTDSQEDCARFNDGCANCG